MRALHERPEGAPAPHGDSPAHASPPPPDRYCCRRMMLTHVDLVPLLLKYTGDRRSIQEGEVAKEQNPMAYGTGYAPEDIPEGCRRPEEEDEDDDLVPIV
eukprot:TRINITY_DN11722_c0_g1_i1.p3 TRINITY_DN11722_c0_g1~~TRINITY_DN11722_c0_g1_i1.p3  ORF type:complete len:100 (+),score=22.97 TRINITY_DN11722_c0_g1_i1:226-525(+)